MNSPRIEIYRSFNHHGCRCMTPCSNPKHQEYRWRMRAGNGRIVAESGEGYLEPRNLVRGLEIAHPGYFLDADPWLGWLLEHYLVSDSIPVTVPDGTESLWAARRNR